MQVAHGGQHVGAVGALLAARLDQAAGLEALEHRVQQQVLRLAGDEAGAELGQHAEVEAGVGQLEPERILPVDPGAHGVGRLPVAEVLEELEDRDQGQPPWGESGLAPAGIEPPEILVLVEGAELVAQPHDDGALGEGGAGDARGLGRDLTDRVPDEGSWITSTAGTATQEFADSIYVHGD